MNATETARICRAIAGLKPAQHFDDETPAFWALVLADVRFDDAKQAVVNLAGRARFIDPSDILDEVRRIKDDRIDRAEMPIPNANPDDPKAYAAEYRAIRAAIRDGDLQGERLDAYRRGEISLTGVPALAGPCELPDVERAKRMIRDAIPRAMREREAEADEASRVATAAERERQSRELAERYPSAEVEAAR